MVMTTDIHNRWTQEIDSDKRQVSERHKSERIYSYNTQVMDVEITMNKNLKKWIMATLYSVMISLTGFQNPTLILVEKRKQTTIS